MAVPEVTDAPEYEAEDEEVEAEEEEEEVEDDDDEEPMTGNVPEPTIT